MSYLFDYHAQWSGVLCLSLLFFCWQWVSPRFGKIPGLTLFYSCVSALWVYAWKDNRYLPLDPYNQMALRYFSCDSLCKLMILLVPMMMLAEKRLTILLMGEIIGSLFVVVNSLAAIYQSFTVGCTGLTCGGIIGNPSISMGLMVCVLPVFIRSWRRQWPVLAIAATAVFLAKSSIAIGLFSLYCLAWFIPLGNVISATFWVALAQGLAVAGAFFGAAKYALGSELLNDSDRFKVWQFMFERWRAPQNIFTGTGLGTYHVFSVNLQHTAGGVADNMWWNTLHNDPLQMLFECGVVGFALLFFTYLTALFKTLSEKEFHISLSILLYGLYMTVDPALHNPLPVLFGAWLFVYALRKNTIKESLC